jgi:hypothetical protein
MPDFQTFIAILTAFLVFLTGVFLSYDTLQFRNYQLIIPQWAGLLLAGTTFSLVAVDQLLRGLVRLEEEQRLIEEEQQRIKQAERETRRTRIETRYRIAIIQYQLNPNPLHRQQLADILALLQEYQDTL